MEETSLASKNINNTAFNFLPVVIKEINVLLQYVLNIVSSYKVDLNRVEDLVRIDEFHKYDRDLITKSIKDNRLLTKKSNNEISFKNIYQYSYEEKMANQDNISFTNKKLTEPFSILVMGVDSESDGLNANQAFNGDTLMLVTFNPNTLTASMFSIPRDSYVPISFNLNINIRYFLNKVKTVFLYMCAYRKRMFLCIFPTPILSFLLSLYPSGSSYIIS